MTVLHGELVDPCAYPGCSNLTTDTICRDCRRAFRRLLDDVVMDFFTLKRSFPKPAARPQAVKQQTSGPKSFGHPAEWASVTAQEIAQTLRAHHEALAEDNRDEFNGQTKLSASMRRVHRRPPGRTAHESVIVRAAHRYLSAYFDLLCTFHGAGEVADELRELHRRTRSALGHTRIRERLYAPCPHCSMAALVRFPGSAGAPIECMNCGRLVTDALYGAYSHIVATEATEAIAETIDDRLAAYDRARIRRLCTPPAAVPALAGVPVLAPVAAAVALPSD